MFLGIETSCDETSIAVIDENYNLLSCVIFSQDEIHREWGGVFPELASRAHLERIREVFDRAISDANIKISDIKAIGVTYGPGLIGSLLVGLSFAKGLSISLNVPLYGINHLDGHLSLPLIENRNIPLPAIGLIVSGGHTELVYIKDWGIYETLGRTLDDAAGEAFDKVARMLGYSFPGGPIIDEVSKKGKPCIKFPIAKIKKEGFDFSFSGIKTAVFYYLRDNPNCSKEDVACSFQEAAIGALIIKVFEALSHKDAKSIVLGGGVACNTLLREKMEIEGKERKIPIFFPSKRLCTDNGAMIGACLLRKIKNGEPPSCLSISSEPNIILNP
ncbi:MAG: tRNA (adenosine(37)-N6)-threonylcarbamoyltransferase complex transferase subunit TsaD [bacterium]